MSEAEIREAIETQRLTYKEVVGRGGAPQSGWVERVMRTPLLALTPAGTVAKSATA